MAIAQKMTRNECGAFVVRHARLRNLDRLKPCEYGHFDCSDREGGACENEVASRMEEPVVYCPTCGELVEVRNAVAHGHGLAMHVPRESR